MERGEKSFSALLGLLLEAYQACFYKEQYKIIWPNTERIMTWNTLKNYRLIIENQIEKAQRWCNDIVRNEVMCVEMNENWFPKVDVYNSMGYKIIRNNVPHTNNKVNRGQETIYISPIVYPIFKKKSEIN